MNDFSAKRAEALTSHFDIVRRIETLTSEIPFAIKQFKAQVMSFLSMDKRLSSIRTKTEKNTNSRKLDRLEVFVAEYKGAYKKCNQSHASIAKTLDEISSLYSRLSDVYYADGKRREARRAIADGERQDNMSRKQLSIVFARIATASNVSLASEDDDTVTLLREAYFEKEKPAPNFRDENQGARMPKEEVFRHSQEPISASNARYNNQQYNRNSQYNQGAAQYNSNAQYGNRNPQYNANAQFNQNNQYNAPQYAGAGYQQPNAYGYQQPDYRMPPPYYPQMQNVNITPISIDVNAAVESLFESFVKAFEERTAEYLANFEFPEISVGNGADAEVVGKVLEDESFALEKLSVLLEKTNAMLSTLSSITAKYAELEEKTRAISDSIKSATDTQRNLAREIQGIQATQKVIGVDQLKLAEEQTIVLEAQKTAISRQAELSEIETAISSELSAVLDGANKTLSGFKESSLAQSGVADALDEIMSANGKLLELQKNLEEKQSELTEMQREAILAHKRIARSQKAVNERLGAKTRKEKNAEDSERESSDESEALV